VARRVDRVYDFALPPLVLHTLYTRDASSLRRWLAIRPHNAVTVLDTHDGIGVADVAAAPDGTAGGLLPREAIDRLVEMIHERSRGESRQASGAAAQNVDAWQINCTFYDALGRRDDEHLVARAIQLFVPGIPQVYYVGLLAGTNDLDLLRRTGVGRDINRHYYTHAELLQALEGSIARSLLALLRLRNTHPAFSGTFREEGSGSDRLTLVWETDAASARLEVDLMTMRATAICSDAIGAAEAWRSAPPA
jgi:sucrose phosphorylase